MDYSLLKGLWKPWEVLHDTLRRIVYEAHQAASLRKTNMEPFEADGILEGSLFELHVGSRSGV